MFMVAIAKLYGCNPVTVRRILRKREVVIRD
jgi:hypothetical protein